MSAVLPITADQHATLEARLAHFPAQRIRLARDARSVIARRVAAMPMRCRSCCCTASVRARHRGCSSSKCSARRGACSHGMRRATAHRRRSRRRRRLQRTTQRALDDWLDALDIERCVLVGHSLGAIIAGAFAAAYASRVAGLLLVSPASGYGAASAEVRETETRRSVLRCSPNSARKVSPKNAAPTCCPPHASDEARDWVRWNMARIVPQGYAQATHLLANADLAADLARYQRPHRGGGRRGRHQSRRRRRASASRRRRARSLQVVPRAGHAGYIESPAAYTTLIDAFCRAGDGQRSQ